MTEPTNTSPDDELHEYLNACHFGELDFPQSMTPLQRENFEQWLRKWSDRRTAAVLESLKRRANKYIVSNEPLVPISNIEIELAALSPKAEQEGDAPDDN